VYHGTGRRRAPVARRMQGTRIMSTSATFWNLSHVHPQGSWWQYVNDRTQAKLMIAGAGIMALVGAILTVWAVLVA
jgi:hypothetical protein